jgi:enoyl-CoA hydratase/carnithine racemase
MTNQDVLVERQGRVGMVTLNRPAVRNALNRSLLSQLHSALESLAEDVGVGVIVISGAGSAFCAGADLKEGADPALSSDFWARHARVTQSMRIHQLLPRIPKPVIAAVNGAAVAGGCGVAMSCDLVFASDSASFGYPEADRGLVPALVMVSLSRLVGRRQALDLILSARIITAEEALALGMINRVVPREELMTEVLDYAARLASKPATALRITKELFYQVSELDHDRALEHARDVNLLVSSTSEAKRGVEAFGRTTGRKA